MAERFKLYTNCGMDAHGTYGQQYKVFRSLQDAMFFIEGRAPEAGALGFVSYKTLRLRLLLLLLSIADLQNKLSVF